MSDRLVTAFVTESNRIEGIQGASDVEIAATRQFIAGPSPTLGMVCELAKIYTAKAVLRSAVGLDVRVGSHLPPPGGEAVSYRLYALLAAIEGATPYNFHVAYETLHPFMDGNGRTGRALWAWQMVRQRLFRAQGQTLFSDSPPPQLDWSVLELGFLHHFYYQALDASDLRRTPVWG